MDAERMESKPCGVLTREVAVLLVAQYVHCVPIESGCKCKWPKNRPCKHYRGVPLGMAKALLGESRYVAMMKDKVRCQGPMAGYVYPWNLADYLMRPANDPLPPTQAEWDFAIDDFGDRA